MKRILLAAVAAVALGGPAFASFDTDMMQTCTRYPTSGQCQMYQNQQQWMNQQRNDRFRNDHDRQMCATFGNC